MIPYTYKMVNLDGLDITNIVDQEFSGLYQKISQAIETGEVIIIYNWYVAGIKIPPTYVEIEIGNGYYLINDLIYINSDDTISIPTMSAPSIIRSLSVYENGTYNVPSGVDGYNPVVVSVPEPVIQALRASENGTYNVPTGVDGYNPVVVNVPASVIQQLNVVENGTYNPGSGVDGFSPVVVNIPQKVLVQLTATQNGTYLPSSYNADGFSEVIVNVQAASSNYEEVQSDFFGLATAYIASESFYTWTDKTNCMFLAPVENGKKYVVFLPEQVGNRFRVCSWAGKTFSDFSQYLDGQTASAEIYGGGNRITPVTELTGDGLTRRFFFTGVTGEVLIMTSSASQVIKPILLEIKEEQL